MRLRTMLAVGLVVAALAGVGSVALLSGDTVALSERWVSDTGRDTLVNHHAVGASGDFIVAPVAVPARDGLAPGDCALVALDADGEVRWRATVPPANCSVHSLTEPAVGDIDDDGALEAVVASTERALVVYGVDGEEANRIPLATYGYGRPTIADVDGDGTNEIVVSDIRGQVTVVSDGAVAWRRDLDASVFTHPRVVDADGDGDRDILVGTNRRLVRFDADGTISWTTDRRVESMVVVDAADDLAREVLVATTRELALIEGDTGEVAWVSRLDANPTVRAATDLDGDGVSEAFVGLTDGRVVAVDASDGSIEWETSVSSDRRRIPPPVLGDVDGDGSEDVIVATNEGRVVVLDAASGALRADYRRDVPIWTVPTPADLNGDGTDEVLVRYGDGRVAALSWA